MAKQRSRGARKQLGQVLKARGVVDEASIQQALVAQRTNGGLIGERLVELGLCTKADIASGLAEQAGLECVSLKGVEPTADVLELVDGEMARAFGLIPLGFRGETLLVALSDPLNLPVLEDLSFSIGREVSAVIAESDEILALANQSYGTGASFEETIKSAAKSAAGEDAQSAAQSAPVVRLLNSILFRAIRDHASDVHFEVFPNELRIRFRVDGALFEIDAPPAHLAAPLVARLKVMSDLDIAETKLPQDGRIELVIDGRPVDLRVATLPCVSGENCVLRVLDRSSIGLTLEAIGAKEAERTTLTNLTARPHGVVLLTGPTGSGKTTTLYAMLSEINDPETKIITVEDPVEYDIEGIIQIPIHEDIGVNYAQVLRSILRHDPDKILIGEIRDEETAAVAVEASLTGHLVLSTVHTNDAPSAIARLLDLSIEPFLVTATLEAVIAQRLVRLICSNCRTEYQPDVDIEREFTSQGIALQDRTLAYGKGCEACFHTGFRGRTAIFEMMLLNDAMRAAILAGEPTDKLRELAVDNGLITLRESGLRLAALGQTTLEEVIRETLGV
ncbi:MAG: type IV pilus assembly protein PilB [Planctomycetota bacterium]|jgi:type IV pilus assembly protein PilB